MAFLFKIKCTCLSWKYGAQSTTDSNIHCFDKQINNLNCKRKLKGCLKENLSISEEQEVTPNDYFCSRCQSHGCLLCASTENSSVIRKVPAIAGNKGKQAPRVQWQMFFTFSLVGHKMLFFPLQLIVFGFNKIQYFSFTRK